MAGFRHRIIRRTLGTLVGAIRGSQYNIQKLRRMTDMGAMVFFMPWGVERESIHIDEVPAEWIIPHRADHNKVILYLHGGGYAVGSKQTHRSLVGQIAKKAGYCALLIEYRLAPENPYPAALEDAVRAYKWLLETGHDPKDIVIAGDSAGGGLSMATLLQIKEEGIPMPACSVLLSPWVDLTMSHDSVYNNIDRSPMLFLREMKAWARNYAGIYPLDHPQISPLFADLADLPPILIQLSDAEVLVDEGLALAEKGREAGIDITLEEYQGLIHVWHVYWRYLPKARQAIKGIVDYIDRFSPSEIRDLDPESESELEAVSEIVA